MSAARFEFRRPGTRDEGERLADLVLAFNDAEWQRFAANGVQIESREFVAGQIVGRFAVRQDGNANVAKRNLKHFSITSFNVLGPVEVKPLTAGPPSHRTDWQSSFDWRELDTDDLQALGAAAGSP